MGCFLVCFGSSKDRKRSKQRRKIQPRDQRNAALNPAQSAVSLIQNNPEKEKLTTPVSEIRFDYKDNPEEQLSLSARKKVTFSSNVTTYDHISVEESTESFAEKEDGGEKEKEKNLAKSSQSQSSSEDSSVTSSSTGSYPSNNRYQNCRDSDDELDYGESESEEEEDEDEDEDDYDYDDIYEDDEVDSSAEINSLPERGEVKPNPNVRDRSIYVHSVLNPVENLTQWKALKAKGKPPLKQQKENLTLVQESSSSAHRLREVSFSFEGDSDESKKSNQEIAVDASLSNWLGSSDSTPINKTSRISFNSITAEKSLQLGSNSPISFEDRPILGALTVEELKQREVPVK